MKQLKFLETKRTPRYSMRKLNVGMASVLLGVTIFGINLTNHSVKAATRVEPSATEEVQQGSADTGKTATGTPDTGKTATGTPDTGKTATGTSGRDRSAEVTVDPNNINTQPDKENQELANKHNLTSSDNYSSNIYKGKDGKYYKIVTIYGNDYVYRAADIQANGTAFGQYATTAADTKNNINISKEDLGNGKTRWTVKFFPHKGLQNVGSNLSGLQSAKFGIALTNDYQIVGDVDMDITTDPNQTFVAHTFKDNSNRSTDITVSNPSHEVKFSFNPNTDVDPNTGLINSKTMPAYNNQYLQGPYYFNTDANAGRRNLWQTYFEDGVEYNNAYDENIPYLGGNHDFHLNNFEIKNKTGVDGAKQKDKIIYDTLGYRLNSKNANPNGVFSSDNFNQAMEFKSQGVTDQSQFSSYKISFTTQHTDSHEVELTTGPKNQQFSGIAANIYSFQNKYYNMFSSLYGEQRALNPADAAHPDAPLTPLNPKDIIPNWQIGEDALAKINKDYLNNAQINALSSEIHNNAADPDALAKIVDQGNALNDAMKKLGNSIGQYDSDGSFADHKEDTTKASDRYKYASPDKQKAYDNATEATKALINKDTGAYADQATVEKLTEAENDAWSALDGKKPTDAEKTTPKVPSTKEPVANTSHLTDGEKAKVQKNVEDANKDENGKSTLPDGTTVTVGDDGTATVTYPDKTTDTIQGSDLVRPATDKTTPSVPATDKTTPSVPATDAEKTTPKVPSTKEPVANTSHLTDGEKAKVQKNVEDANKDENGKSTLPDGTTVTVGDDGTATVTYPDKTTDTIQGSDLVRPATDAEKTTPKVPSTKEPVANTSHLTDGEKAKVQKNVEDANKDENGKSTLPDGTTVTVGDDGTATVTYPDKTTDTIQGSDLVRPATDAEKTTPKVPSTKEPVANTSHLTDGEKAKVQKNVEDANKDENGKSTLPDGTTVTVGDDGTATVTYPDKTTDTIQGSDLVRPATDKTTPSVPATDKTTPSVPATDAEKTTPKVPSTKEPVANTSHLTDGEKAKVQKNVEDANKDENGKSTLPDGTTVTVGDDGTATVTYPDKTTDTIQGSDLVRPATDKTTPSVPATDKTTPSVPATDAEKTTPKVPSTKEPVANTSHLTDGEKAKVQKNVEDANKDENGKSTLPDGTTVTVGDDGTATVTYPDKTTDTIQGSDLVRPATDAEKTTPKVPSTKEPVANTSHLTDGEKAKVQKNVEDANKDENGKSTLPDGTTVTVGDDGTATVTYPDKTTDTIQGSDLVRPATDAEKTTPKVPSTKEPVANTSHLTDGEKAKVQKNVEDANKDENGKSTLPDGTTVTVGDDGTATVTYPDKTTDTIQGSDLVRPATDAEKTTPKVPSTKEPVANTSHLTDGEKAKVQKNVEDANKDENGKSTLPDGTTVTVGDDGTATVTYPDKTTDTIQGSDLVRPATDAEKTTPKVPSTKEPVANTSHLTDGEKAKVQKNVEDANKDENGKSTLPDGTTVTVGDDGTATVTYPDKTTDTIQGSDLVRPATDAEKTTPKVPSTKEPVANTSHLTDGEKAKVQKNVEDANKDENGKSTLPDGTTVTVGDDGTATVTYPDKTTDTIQGSDLVRPATDKTTPSVPATDAEKTTPKVPSTKEPVANTSHLTDGEKAKVQKNVEDANKDENGKSTLPDGTTVTVGDDGTATVTYPDKTTDTIQGSDLVRPATDKTTPSVPATDAEKTTPKVPSTKEPVANTSHLTDGEKAKVQKNVEDANKDENGKSTLPDGTTVTVDDKGNATVTYPDGSKDTIPGDQLVQGQKGDTPVSKPEDSKSDQGKTDKDDTPVSKPEGNKSDQGKTEKGDTPVSKPEDSKSDQGKTEKGDTPVSKPEDSKSDQGKTDKGDTPVSKPEDSKSDQGKTDKGDTPVSKPEDSKSDQGKTDKGDTPVSKPEDSKSDQGKTDKGDTPVSKPEDSKSDQGKTDKGDTPVSKPEDSKSDQGKTDKGDTPVSKPEDSKSDQGKTDKGDTPVSKPEDSKSDQGKTDKGDTPVSKPEDSKSDQGKTDKGDTPVSKPEDSKSDQGKTDKGDTPVSKPEDSKSDQGKTDKGDTPVSKPEDSKSDQGKTDKDDTPVSKPEGNKSDQGKTEKGDTPVSKPEDSKSDQGKTEKGDTPVSKPEDSKSDQGKTEKGDTPVSKPEDSKSDQGKTEKGDTPVSKPEDSKSDQGKTDKGDTPVSKPEDSKSDQGKTDKDDTPVSKPEGNKSDQGKTEKGDTPVSKPEDSKSDQGKTEKGDTPVSKPEGNKSDQGKTEKGDTTDAGNITPTVPGDKVTVKDPSHLTDDEKKQVKNNVDNANKDKFPAGTDVTVGDDGTATVNYPDGSKDTIPGDQLVQGQKGDTTDAGNITPTVPGDKVTVKDPSHLTDNEKKQVKNNVDNANKDKFPAGTTVTVGDNGTATVTYPDGSKDTIPGDQLVQGQKGSTTDAGNITPTVPGGKVTVKDPSHLTDNEKNQVKNNVDNANKDKFPAGTDVTVGDNGTATVTYPDGSKDTIPGDQLVQGQKGSTTDAGNITPTVPGGKVTVKDPSHLTDDEKNQVKNNVDNANKDKFPEGTKVTVGDDGTATVNYPDGSKDTIPGDQLVQGQKGSTTDAGNITPTVPGDKVTVKDPSHLTDDEKNQVKNNVDNANKDKFPAGTTVTVGDDGTATVTYPDGSKDTIPGDQLVQGQKGDTTDAGNITPTVPGGKVTVKDPSHLTDDEKNQVKNNVDNANKDKFPAGTTVTVGNDGTATVTYPDGSKDVISGTDLVIAAKSEDVLGSKYHSHENGSNSSQADRVKGASTANGSIANAGNNLGVKAESDNAIVGVKAESDNAIGNNKATSLKTLPQTGTKDTSILGVLGMLLASLGLFGFKKKRDKE